MNPDSSLPTPERPVFASSGIARPRALRLAGRAAAGMVGLWLVALMLGAFGFGHIPGFRLPQIIGEDHPKSAKLERSGATKPAVATHARPATAIPVADRTSGHHGPASSTAPSRSGPSGGSGGGGNVSTTSPSAPSSSPSVPTAATPTSSATPSPAPTSSPSPSTHSNANATPPGSSSNDPGSRSHATTAPGRDHSQTTPTPGQGQGTGKPPTG